MHYAINLVVLEEIRPFIILQIGVKTSYYINCEKNSIHRKRKQMQKKKERAAGAVLRRTLLHLHLNTIVIPACSLLAQEFATKPTHHHR